MSPNGYIAEGEPLRPLEPVDDLITAFADTANLEVVRYYHDLPEISLRWRTEDEIERKIQVALDEDSGTTVGVWTSAWRDDEEKLIRYSTGGYLDKDISLTDRERLSATLKGAFAEVSRWSVDKLQTETPLPPMPP